MKECGSDKKDWASIEWLLTHFWAKSSDRLRQFAALPIKAGDVVLDVGCGPAVYMSYALDLVGPRGHVTGLDRLASSLDYAKRLLTIRGADNWSLIAKRFEDYLEDIERYDVVMFMNSLGYFESPHGILQEVAARLRPGSRIIVKDYDLESIFLHPIDRDLLGELMRAAIDVNSHNNPLAFSNFFGREVPFLAGAFNFSNAENRVWSQSMTFPFADKQRRYISENIVSLLDQARSQCRQRVVEYFETEFIVGGSFFERKDAIFTENEYVTIMTR